MHDWLVFLAAFALYVGAAVAVGLLLAQVVG